MLSVLGSIIDTIIVLTIIFIIIIIVILIKTYLRIKETNENVKNILNNQKEFAIKLNMYNEKEEK